MKRILLTLAAAFLSGMSLLAQGPLDVKEITLSNGMTVWLNEDHSEPKCYGAVVVRAGAVDCPNTGIAHYFEHIMFKGTDRIGTVDYEAEKVYLDSIETMYSRLAETYADDERKAIQQEINRLSLLAAEYAIPNEYTSLISQYGGTGLNAGTSFDYTVYYNTFDSRYLRPWALLNSERLIHPVFRLFQGELETVYEEKNMSSDRLGGDALERALAAFAGENYPYAFPIIGSTENLKNPDQLAMKAFFEKYYVASNMGLILTGDFDADAVAPMLEETFGRIPRGVEPEHLTGREAPLKGVSEVRIKLPIPVVKAEVLTFNGPLDSDPDALDFQVAASLLTNSAGTGLLDSLMTDHKALALMGTGLAMNHMSASVLVAVPNIMGSMKKTERMLWEQVDKVCEGRFSDRALAEVKRDIRRDMDKALETMDGRGEVMTSVMSQGRSWADYLAQVASVDAISRERVMAAAKKYYNSENYLKLRKTYGNYPKDKVAKPDYKPVVPPHRGEASAFAQEMEAEFGPVPFGEPKTVDPATPEVTRIPLGPRAKLYASGNPVNDLFELRLSYHIGTDGDPKLTLLGMVLPQIGTDSLKVQDLQRAWQRIGTQFSVVAEKNDFAFVLSGYESSLDESLALLRHFLDRAVVDKKTLSAIVSEYRQSDMLNFVSGPSEIFSAMVQKTTFGDNAPNIKRLTPKEAGKIKGDALASLLREEVLTSECSATYSGTADPETVARKLKAALPLDRSSLQREYVVSPYQVYDKPTVFFYNQSGVRQVFLGAYITDDGSIALPGEAPRAEGAPAMDAARKARLRLWGQYFGGGMSSVLFDEIREYRAYAYSAHGYPRMPDKDLPGDPGIFVGYLSTQADKFDSAMAVMDSLIHQMPAHPVSAKVARQDIINSINASYPSFRELPSYVADLERRGYTANPVRATYEAVKDLGIEDIVSYQQNVIAQRPVVWIVVGDKKLIDMEKLATYGEIVFLKEKDILRK